MAGRREEIAEERRRSAEDALRRSDEGDFLGGTVVGRAAGRLGAHLSAADRDPADRAALWGARVGRGLGLLALAGLAAYLFVTYGPQ